MKEALLDPSAVFGMGLSLILIGVLLWNFNKIFSQKMRYREIYTEVLEEEGEYSRRDKLKNETEIIKRRIPIYGKVLFIIGVICIGTALFLL